MEITNDEKPLVIPQYDLWGNVTYVPAALHSKNATVRPIKPLAQENLSQVEGLKRKKLRYLNKHYIPADWPVEGVEEFPCLLQYNGILPKDVVGVNDSMPRDCSQLGLHGFCYDHVLFPYWLRIENLINKAKHFLCAFGPDFSVLVDGRRCDTVEALRRNRIMTLSMQLSGINTIQTYTFGNADSFEISIDGLASNCPTAVEHNVSDRDPARQCLFRLAIKELVRRKNPNILIVFGFDIGFDPGIPVVYYKTRIQKMRERYGKMGKRHIL